MEMQFNGTDRRRSQRVESNLPMTYKNLKIAMTPAGSMTKNLSEGGVRFKTSEFVSLACRLVLEITLPTAPRPVKAISKVAWIKRGPSGDHYELGNQFLEISKEDKSVISDYVNRISTTTA